MNLLNSKYRRLTIAIIALTLVASFFYLPVQNYGKLSLAGANTAYAEGVKEAVETFTATVSKFTSYLSNPDKILDLLADLANSFFSAVDWIFSWVIIVASAIFETVVYQFVIKLSTYFQKGEFVEKIWIQLRNFSNIFFIFILLYIGIMTIIQPITKQTFDWGKRTIAVIIAALLINFSLPLTKTVVDISNIVAYQFYSKMKSEPDKPIGVSFNLEKLRNVDLRKEFMVWSVIEAREEVSKKLKSLVSGKGLAAGLNAGVTILNILLIAVMAYGIVYGAFIILVRFIAVVVLVAVSPLPFLLWHFRPTQPYAHMYIRELIASCAVLPVFMACLYIALFTAKELPRLLGTGSGTAGASTGATGSFLGTAAYAAGADGSGASIAMLMIGYLVPAAMVIGATIIAKQVGGSVGSMAEAATKKVAAYGTLGIGAYAGSRVGGAMLNNRLGNWVDQKTGGRITQFSTKAAAITNSGLAMAGVAPLASTTAQRLEAKETSDKAKEKTRVDTRVAALKNMVKAQGLEDKGREAEHAKVIDSLKDKEVQKAYYKSLDPKQQKAVEGSLSPTTKSNLISLRSAQVKDNPKEIADHLNGLKGDDLIEFYTDPTKMKDYQKQQVEKLLSPETKKALDSTLTFNQRKLGKMAELEGNIAGQMAYLKNTLASNPTDQELFFTSLSNEDAASLLNQLEASGTGGKALALNLKNSLSKSAKGNVGKEATKIAAAQDTTRNLTTANNSSAAPSDIKNSLQWLSENSKDKLLKGNMLSKPHVLPHISVELLRDLSEMTVQRKAVVNNLIQSAKNPGYAGPMPTSDVLDFVMDHPEWK
ncbi:MAG: hypothetical protein HZA95_03505 [Candidatus Vogelbacteria bacterium]|nr:hypothetical protein [Candidatus Vogelbacteria bacterium]